MIAMSHFRQRPKAPCHLLLLQALFLSLAIGAVQGAVHHVRGSGINPVPPYDCWNTASNTIQGALDVCATNDSVLVRPGDYLENLVWPQVNGITLISTDGPDYTSISGSMIGANSIIRIDNVNGATVGDLGHGFIIRNGNSAEGGGILVNGSTALIRGNVITNNSGYDGGGICVTGEQPSAAIEYNQITNNSTNYLGGGISVRIGASAVIQHNLITGNVNQAYEGGGVFS